MLVLEFNSGICIWKLELWIGYWDGGLAYEWGMKIGYYDDLSHGFGLEFVMRDWDLGLEFWNLNSWLEIWISDTNLGLGQSFGLRWVGIGMGIKIKIQIENDI